MNVPEAECDKYLCYPTALKPSPAKTTYLTHGKFDHFCFMSTYQIMDEYYHLFT